MHQFVVPMSGLSCMGCVKKLEKTLRSKHTIEIIDASPTRLELKTDATLLDIAQTISSLGLPTLHFSLLKVILYSANLSSRATSLPMPRCRRLSS